MYRVVRTASFIKEASKILTREEMKELENFKDNLKTYPYFGDQLKYKFFREKKFKGKRAYFLIYEEIKLIAFIAIGDKKNQNEIIKYILERLEDFKEYFHKSYQS